MKKKQKVKKSETEVLRTSLLVLLICFATFSMGVFVGKSWSDRKHDIQTVSGKPVLPAGRKTKKTEGILSIQKEMRFLNNENQSVRTSHATVSPQVIGSGETPTGQSVTDPLKFLPGQSSKIQRYGSRDKKTDFPALPSSRQSFPFSVTDPSKLQNPSFPLQTSITSGGSYQTADPRTETSSEFSTRLQGGEESYQIADPRTKTSLGFKTEPQGDGGSYQVADPKIETSSPISVQPSTSKIISYTVQVAAYKMQKEAEEHSESLVDRGFPAFSEKAIIQGENWFRVNIGSFKTKRQALKYEKALKKQTFIKKSFVRKTIQPPEE